MLDTIDDKLANTILTIGGCLLLVGLITWLLGWFEDVYIMGFPFRSSITGMGVLLFVAGQGVLSSREKSIYERVRCSSCGGTGKDYTQRNNVHGGCSYCSGSGYYNHLVATKKLKKWDLGDSSELGGLARIVGISATSLWAVSMFTGWFSGATFLGFHVMGSLFYIGLLGIIAGYFPGLITVGFIFMAIVLFFSSSSHTVTGEPINTSYKVFMAGILVVLGLFIPRFFLKK